MRVPMMVPHAEAALVLQAVQALAGGTE